MNTCNTCRFWNRNGKPFPEHRFGEYGIPESEGTQHRRCLRVLHNSDSRHDDFIDEPAFVTDGSGYTAALRTLPTFGCVLHEAGDPPKRENQDMIHAIEEILAHKRKAGSTTYVLHTTEVEALVNIVRRAEDLLGAKPLDIEAKRFDLITALREINAFE